MPDRKLSPCARQTEVEIANYYRNQPEGSPAVVRRTHGGILTYQITTFGLRRTRTGRINVEGVGDFYMKSGKNCWEPTGQTRLLAAFASIDASLCGVLRAFFGCFLSLLSGMKTVVPFSTVGALVSVVVMVFLLLAWVGAQRCAPTLPVGESGGCKVQGRPGRRGSPDLHKRIEAIGESGKHAIRAECWGNRPGRAPAIPCAAPGGRAPKQTARPERSGGRAQEQDQHDYRETLGIVS